MAADEEGFFEDWPKWSKPVFALSTMILLGGVWIGIPLLSAWKLGYDNAQAAVPMDYEPMMALLIAMTTVTITGIFVFMTFRIDRGTRLKAERVAKEKINELVEAELAKFAKTSEGRLNDFRRASGDKLGDFGRTARAKFAEFKKDSDDGLSEFDSASKKRLGEFDGASKKRFGEFDAASERRLGEFDENVKKKLVDFEKELDDSAKPEVIQEAIHERIPEQTLRAHIEAVLLANVNGQIVKEYAKERAAEMKTEDIEALLRLLKETIENVAPHAAERPEDAAADGPSGSATMATWWHRLLNRRD